MKAQFFHKNVLGQLTAIFFIQASSATAFAVFYSGLSIYLTQNKHFIQELASIITGLFLSLHYALPLIGGVIVNRFISYKNFYFLGTVFSFLGCLLLAWNYLYLGLSLFLMSSLVNGCINMFLTQLFSINQRAERKIAFMWNYIGMNLGFMGGFFLTGISTLSNSYFYLFILMSIFVLFALICAALFIKEPELQFPLKKSIYHQIVTCSFIMITLMIIIDFLFYFSFLFRHLITMFSIFLLCIFIFYGFKKSKNMERKNLIKFFCFLLLAIIFWSFYMLTPIAIMQLIYVNVKRDLFNVNLAPQWLSNIDSFIILIFAPLITLIIKNTKVLNNSLNYFLIGFVFTFIGFTITAFGLYFSLGQTKISLWIILSYMIFLTFAEMFISPTNDSLIGEFVAERFRALMTGMGRAVICVGVLFASAISDYFILPYINKSGFTYQDGISLCKFFFLASCVLLILVIVLLCVLNSKKLFFNTNKYVKIASLKT